MEKVFEFLDKNPLVSLATVDDKGHPQVRAFRVMGILNGRIYFFTGSGKAVYKQLAANPRIAFTATSAEDVSIRVTGDAVIVDDQELKQGFLDTHPNAKALYKSADNPVLKLFYIVNVSAEIFDLSQTPPKREFFK
jgi:uncharacterized pyridoxamine 5'-phosphate oxidase family protein